MGLLLYAFGAFLFYPAAQQRNFDFFVLALFVLASGLTCLETAANPYVTVLGPPQTSELQATDRQLSNGLKCSRRSKPRRRAARVVVRPSRHRRAMAP